jgi:hypothetical protein
LVTSCWKLLLKFEGAGAAFEKKWLQQLLILGRIDYTGVAK